MDNNSTTHELHKCTLGKDGLDLKQISKSDKYLLYSPGYIGIASCKSKITYIDGLKGKLVHRGYDIKDLIENCDYIDVMYLLLNGSIPNRDQYTEFLHDLETRAQKMPLEKLQISKSSMNDLVSALSQIAGMRYSSEDCSSLSVQDIKDDALDILAYIPTIIWHICNKKSIIEGRGFIEWFCNNSSSHISDRSLVAKIIHGILILHADHEQNASTTTVRNIASTNANPYMAVIGGIAALSGPLHGMANVQTLKMLQHIGSVNNIDSYIAKAKNKEPGCLIYGFGHRVYKLHDPRANILLDFYSRISEFASDNNKLMFKIADKLRNIALNDDYFKSRNLYPNVDFYSGLVLKGIGIKESDFTLMFAFGRMVGWLSHILEQNQDKDTKIARPSQIYIGETERKI